MTTATNGSTPTTRVAAAAGASRPMPVAPRVAAPKGRRRPLMLALGLALVAVGALTSVWLVSSASQRVAVLVLARDVPYGSPITAADLTTTDVSVDPNVATIPASELDTVVGSVAATSLSAGSLLSRPQFTAAAPLDSPAAAVAMVAASPEASAPQPAGPEVAVGVSIQPLGLQIAATARRPEFREE